MGQSESCKSSRLGRSQSRHRSSIHQDSGFSRGHKAQGEFFSLFALAFISTNNLSPSGELVRTISVQRSAPLGPSQGADQAVPAVAGQPQGEPSPAPPPSCGASSLSTDLCLQGCERGLCLSIWEEMSIFLLICLIFPFCLRSTSAMWKFRPYVSGPPAASAWLPSSKPGPTCCLG